MIIGCVFTSLELTNGSYPRSLWQVLMFTSLELTNGSYSRSLW